MFSRTGIGCLVLGLLCLSLRASLVIGLRMKFASSTGKCGNTFALNCSSWVENGTFNLDMTTIQAIDYGLHLFIDIQIKLQGSKKYQSMISYDVEYCKVVNQVFGASILRTWFKNVIKYSNFMENCPVVKGYYYVRKFIMEPSSIPVYLQAGTYRINVHAYHGKRNTKKERLALKLAWDVLFF